MPTRPFEFSGTEGLTLSGRIEMPQAPVRGWALFAHCFTCGKDNLAAVRIARQLAAGGIGVMRFDFAGIGASGGELAASSFTLDVGNLIAAADAMAAEGMTPSVLIGHSLGGAAALAAAGDMPGIRAIATIAAPAQPGQAASQFSATDLATVAAEGEAEVHLAGRPFRVSQDYIDDLGAHDLTPRIGELRRPLLILHAPFDDTVDIENATRIFQAARHPKSFVSLDQADHLLTRPADSAYVASVILGWVGRYLPAVTDTAIPMSDVEAEETGTGKFQVAIRANTASFIADEPESVGGLNSGPSPFELLSAALAACTTMTLRLYADGKGWPVERIRTSVGHRREGGSALPDVFSRRIAIEGAIDADQRARLLSIAERCPVHRTLERGAHFDTVIGNPPANAEPVEAHAAAMKHIMD